MSKQEPGICRPSFRAEVQRRCPVLAAPQLRNPLYSTKATISTEGGWSSRWEASGSPLSLSDLPGQAVDRKPGLRAAPVGIITPVNPELGSQ